MAVRPSTSLYRRRQVRGWSAGVFAATSWSQASACRPERATSGLFRLAAGLRECGPVDRRFDDRRRPLIMFGEILYRIFAAAKRGIHDLLMLGSDVAARFSCDAADQAGQSITLRLDVEPVCQFKQARRTAMGDQRVMELMMPFAHCE